MKGESILSESDEFAPRKVVGRPPTPRQILWQIDPVRQFTDKFTRGKPKLTAGDLFPVRKIVGPNHGGGN